MVYLFAEVTYFSHGNFKTLADSDPPEWSQNLMNIDDLARTPTMSDKSTQC